MTEDQITVQEFRSRLARLCFASGCHWPRQRRDRQIILKCASLCFEEGRHYDQFATDSLLQRWLHTVGAAFRCDHVYLRRLLVEGGFLARTRDGSRYWRTAGAAQTAAFDPEIDWIELSNLLGELHTELEVMRKGSRGVMTAPPRPSGIVQRLPGGVSLHWEVERQDGNPGYDLFDATMHFIGYLFKFMERASGTRVKCGVEWEGEFTFMGDRALAVCMNFYRVAGLEEAEVPVLVLYLSGSRGARSVPVDPGQVAIAYLVPRFRARGSGREISIPPLSPEDVDGPVFAYRAAGRAFGKAIRAAALRCVIKVERLEVVRNGWKPAGFVS